MSLTAIVPVWNQRALLERLLTSLEEQTAPAAELIVVDNGSEDGAPGAARDRGARVLPMGRNAGFAAAVNRGIQECRTDWIAVLNSDVRLAPDYFVRLLEAAQRTGAWFVSGKILVEDGSCIDGTFDVVCRGGTAWRVGSGRSDGPMFAEGRSIWSAPWTAAVFRTELFQRVGLLDEGFESYLEDVDFGLRCAALELAGRYVPDAVAWHRGSAALGRWHPETVRHIARNQLFLLARHYPAPSLFRWAWPIAVAQVLWGGVALRHGAGFSWLRGVGQGLRHYSATRRAGKPIPAGLLDHLLRANEQIIHEFQAATAFDPYWKLYFLLTRSGAK